MVCLVILVMAVRVAQMLVLVAKAIAKVVVLVGVKDVQVVLELVVEVALLVMDVLPALELVLALAMVISLAACGTKNNADNTPKELVLQPEVDEAAYLEKSEKVFNDVLSDFVTAYEAAKAETKNVSKRDVLMAIAEAKLLEAAVYVPGSSSGGNYAVGYSAPPAGSPIPSLCEAGEWPPPSPGSVPPRWAAGYVSSRSESVPPP